MHSFCDEQYRSKTARWRPGLGPSQGPAIAKVGSRELRNPAMLGRIVDQGPSKESLAIAESRLLSDRREFRNAPEIGDWSFTSEILALEAGCQQGQRAARRQLELPGFSLYDCALDGQG